MQSHLQTPPSVHDHYIGTLHALAVIVEYGDFESPHCGVLAQVMEQLLNEFHSDLCLIYRHFPLPNNHPHAILAALASEAGNQQGEFWNMYSLIYQNYDRLTPELISECAEELGLDMNKFTKDLQRQDLLERINIDINSGDKNGVTNTPALYINGVKFEGSATYHPLREKIERIIAEGQATYI
ncbi:MAG: thioredoxin domain-containing protein [Bacteriovorax sp.]|jgi:protein-disulfide isomerase